MVVVMQPAKDLPKRSYDQMFVWIFFKRASREGKERRLVLVV